MILKNFIGPDLFLGKIKVKKHINRTLIIERNMLTLRTTFFMIRILTNR
jgi:hypothetical protein